MITENKTGCCFITVDAYATAVGFYMKNGFRFLGEKERKGYENWENAHPDFRAREFIDDNPPLASSPFPGLPLCESLRWKWRLFISMGLRRLASVSVGRGICLTFFILIEIRAEGVQQ